MARVNTENKYIKRVPGRMPSPHPYTVIPLDEIDYTDVVGGYDFPVFVLKSSVFVGARQQTRKMRTFIMNDFDMRPGMKLYFLEELQDTILANGSIKRYRKGWRLYCEIVFTALQQLDTEFDKFLLEMHKANKITLVPHRDHSWNKFDVLIDNGWEYNYWMGKPYLGWEGVIKLRGIKRFDELPLQSVKKK